MPDYATEHRKLAAIMFTDMVGYSALSQRNEALALELLGEHRQLLRSVFPKHQGLEIKSTGDGFLVEFPSALAAVQCAVEIQKSMRERNAARSTERRVLVRIGIHLGDVVRREGDVFGDGVNIAARIEPLAEPGGICVSRAVYEQIENKVDHALVQLSKPALKNIQATVEVYRLMLDEPRGRQRPAGKSRVPMVLAGVAVAVCVILFLIFRPPSTSSNIPAKSTNAVAGFQKLWQADVRILRTFGPTNVEGATGWGPVILAKDGYLYGGTARGGPDGGGSLYRMKPDGADYKMIRLLNTNDDGAEPLGGVIQGRDGALYGTTFRGGQNGEGTIFRVATDGSDFRVFHHFARSNDCRNPQAELLEAKDGFLYGTTQSGGGRALGGVFRIAIDGTGYRIVTGFYHGQPDDPKQPIGGLVQTPDGAFYGTTKQGGLKDNGTIYKLAADGSFTVVRSLGLEPGGITQPEATLLLASDGILYGTCSFGGEAGYGAVFRLAPDGSGFEVVRALGATLTEARESHTGLIEAADGTLLGTSRNGGAENRGTVFRLTKDGRGYQTLHSFMGGNDSGAGSRSTLTRGPDGVYFGGTAGGGRGNLGTVFRMTVSEVAAPSIDATR